MPPSGSGKPVETSPRLDQRKSVPTEERILGDGAFPGGDAPKCSEDSHSTELYLLYLLPRPPPTKKKVWL